MRARTHAIEPAAGELPVVDTDASCDYNTPEFDVFLCSTRDGDGELLEAMCPDCRTRSVIERIHGETRDLRCCCGSVLRLLG